MLTIPISPVAASYLTVSPPGRLHSCAVADRGPRRKVSANCSYSTGDTAVNSSRCESKWSPNSVGSNRKASAATVGQDSIVMQILSQKIYPETGVTIRGTRARGQRNFGLARVIVTLVFSGFYEPRGGGVYRKTSLRYPFWTHYRAAMCEPCGKGPLVAAPWVSGRSTERQFRLQPG